MKESHSADSRVARMLAEIEVDYSYASRLTGLARPGAGVMAAMAEVPREEFVPPDLRAFAFDNRALPIEEGQTISQPFIVALMTDVLRPKAEDVMLEVGTGSGYQAAVLSRLIRQLYSIEVLPLLAQAAERRLKRLGYNNVEVLQGDGYGGWPEHAPYDGIIVTAAAEHIPQPLVEQLKPGARLIIPVREGAYGQGLMLVEKDASGRAASREILPVAFVPLVRGHSREE